MPRGTTDDPLNLTAPERKAALRKELLFKRQQLSTEQQQTFSWQVANHVRELLGQLQRDARGPRSADTLTIAAYWPLAGEVDLSQLYTDLQQIGYTLCLPRVTTPEQPLVFNQWVPGDKMDHDKSGIPCGNGAQLIPSLLLIPCVGFDQRGYRLGSGKGCYDRTLRAFQTPVFTCGIAQSALQVDAVPDEYHDVPLDYVATERALLRCR